jgi:hypothetical protein
LWKDVIRSKYGEEVFSKVDWGEGSKPWFSSLWWKDLNLIWSNLGSNWFARSVKRNMGNGASTSFWLDIWVGNSTLKDRVPRLYSISNKKRSYGSGYVGRGSSWKLEF